MTTSPGRGRPAHDALRSHAAEVTSDPEMIEGVRVAVERYCRIRLVGYRGGVEAAEDIAHDVCRAAVDALQGRQDQGPPLAALVYAIASNKVTEAERRLTSPAA